MLSITPLIVSSMQVFVPWTNPGTVPAFHQYLNPPQHPNVAHVLTPAQRRHRAKMLLLKKKRALKMQRIARGKKAVRVALQQLGIPYVWGGTTRRGFDCSGLMQYAWRRAGIRLPRVTYSQIHVGLRIPNLREARPGDLIFPHTGHVGMYIGNGKMVAAPRRGTVVRVQPVHSVMTIRRPI